MPGNMKFFFDIYDKVMIMQLFSVSLSLVLVFRHLSWKPRTLFRCFYHMVIIYIIGTLLNYSLFELSQSVAFLRGINFPTAWLITIILYLAFFSTMHVFNRFIMGTTLFISVVTMTELGHYGTMVLAQNMKNSAPIVNVLYVVECLFIIGFAVLIKKFSISKYDDIPAISAVLIFINTAVMTGVIYIFTELMILQQSQEFVFYCVVLIAEFVLIITGYMMIWFHCKVRYEKTELEVENRLLESDKSMIMLSEKAVEEMRCLRHDFKNQYQIIKMLLDEGKYKELNEYFESMNLEKVVTKGTQFIDCGNNILNSIINMEIMKAASMGVDFTAKITVAEEITVEKSDLCRVLVNLIDNAIEATEKYEAFNKSVDCKISKSKDYLYICVRNGLGSLENKEQTLKFITSKLSAELHGYGHRIVNRIVNDYNGHVKYSIEEDEFVAEVMLGMQKTDQVF